MSDLATMKARIASELGRSDATITAAIPNAINTAISEYQKQRFRFSDITPNAPPTFNTVADRFIYTSVDNANIGSTLSIGTVWAQVGGMLQNLTQDRPENIRQYNQLGTMKGQPMWWAYEGNQLLIGPTPDQAYAMTLDLFRNVAAPAADDEADNPWMNDAELLIRSRAKYEIALHVTRNKDMQLAMSPHPPEDGEGPGGHAAYYAFRSLKAEANRVTSLRRVRAMQF